MARLLLVNFIKNAYKLKFYEILIIYKLKLIFIYNIYNYIFYILFIL